MTLLLFIALAALIFVFIKKAKSDVILTNLEKEKSTLESEISTLQTRVDILSKYQSIVDAEYAAQAILEEAREALVKAKKDASVERQEANKIARQKIEHAENIRATSIKEAEEIIAIAKQKAEDIAGDAYSAMHRAKEFTDTAQAMKNVIDGYGDTYIIPTYSMLDDLSEEFGFTEAGKKLKAARDTSRAMVKTGQAATCEYVEINRKETAIRFVIDAFNGKVDSILSRGKADNQGTLAQEIKDSFSLVNHNGTAFRNARITEKYLESRLEELKWYAIAQALKEKDREEQRQLREKIREEEKSRREFERAIKESSKEEDTIRKALEKVQQQVQAANEAQRAEYESKLIELEEKLRSAEEKNKRALSMAQQTRTGHVYVISNIGSFGEDVFKIGMTRRLEPKDRVKELGDASVPFEFDVHAMIFSDDAPSLEKKLHRHFLRMQMNKVNPKKEFFRVDLEKIRIELDSLGIEAHWTMTSNAFEYRETLKIEQQILQNPEIEKEWTTHQLSIEEDQDKEEIV